MVSIEFLIASFVVIVVPGTGVVFTVSTALSRGFKASVAAALGCIAGTLPPLASSIFGLSVVYHMSAVAFVGLKIAGTAYLLWLAWTMWKDSSEISFGSGDSQMDFFHLCYRGFLVNVLNPKHFMFFFAFMPQFLSPASPNSVNEMLILGTVFIAIAAMVFVAYGLIASSVAATVDKSPAVVRIIRRSFAGVLAAFAVKLALTTQE